MYSFFIPFAAFNIHQRHTLLKGAIGTFPEEDDAFALAMMSVWLLPLLLLIATIIDAMFIFIYMKYAHPWKAILKKVERATWYLNP